jgi:hypothetical protein
MVTRSKFYDGLDGRRAVAKRFHTLVVDFTRECSGGSSTDDLSPGDYALVKQAAALSLRAEQLQIALCRGEAGVLSDELIRLGSEARRILATVSRRRRLQQQQKEPLTLHEHLTAFKNSGGSG